MRLCLAFCSINCKVFAFFIACYFVNKSFFNFWLTWHGLVHMAADGNRSHMIRILDLRMWVHCKICQLPFLCLEWEGHMGGTQNRLSCDTISCEGGGDCSAEWCKMLAAFLWNFTYSILLHCETINILPQFVVIVVPLGFEPVPGHLWLVWRNLSLAVMGLVLPPFAVVIWKNTVQLSLSHLADYIKFELKISQNNQNLALIGFHFFLSQICLFWIFYF